MTLVEAGGADQDRVGVFEVPRGVVLVVADGAGGTVGGAAAADAMVDAARIAAASGRLRDWTSVLRELDAELGGRGQTTAVVVEVWGDQLCGASVGDSEAWVFGGDSREELTRRQRRKPLIGTGRAAPVPFARRLLDDEVLVIGSDGLFKYATIDRIAAVVARGAACADLVDLVRLPNGALQDDIAVVVHRR